MGTALQDGVDQTGGVEKPDWTVSRRVPVLTRLTPSSLTADELRDFDVTLLRRD